MPVDVQTCVACRTWSSRKLQGDQLQWLNLRYLWVRLAGLYRLHICFISHIGSSYSYTIKCCLLVSEVPSKPRVISRRKTKPKTLKPLTQTPAKIRLKQRKSNFQILCPPHHTLIQEPITLEGSALILSLCHSVLTDRAIYRCTFPAKINFRSDAITPVWWAPG